MKHKAGAIERSVSATETHPKQRVVFSQPTILEQLPDYLPVIKGALSNSSMNNQSTEKIKYDFIFSSIFNDLSVIENDDTSMCRRNSKLIRVSLTLKTSVGSQKSTQALGAHGKSEKPLITNKVTTSFSDSPSTTISYASFLRPTEVFRLTGCHYGVAQ